MQRKVNIIPMAGEGKRFVNEGYRLPKPLIKIKGIPMFVKAAQSLPRADKYIFICLNKHIKKFKLDKTIKSFFPKSHIITLTKKTNGQAVSCMKAIKLLKDNDILNIGSCDYSMKYSQLKFKKKINNSDLVVWTFKNKKIVQYNPNMYGYVKIKKNDVATKITCKKKLSQTPWNDHAIIGTFSFNKAKNFIIFSKKLLKLKQKVNNEYYLDSLAELCLKSGLKVKVNLVDNYYGWGTPKDLNDFIKKNG